MKRYLIFFVIVVAATAVVAQDEVITLTGTITDANTKQGIPFASLQLLKAGSGTATNSSGQFVFKIKASSFTDTLVISSIGYQQVRTNRHATERVLSVALKPAVVELAAVTVKAQTGLDILKEALSKIPENYDTTDVQFTAFYREQVELGDFELNYIEAVLDIYRPFQVEKKLNDQIKVLKGRKKKIDYGREGQLYFWMSGVSNGARGTLSEDLIKYRNAKNSPFNPVNFRNYDYEYIETIKEGERNIVVIDIVPKPKARKGYLRTKVFLDEKSLAIIRYNFELTEKGRRMVSRHDKGVAYAIMSKVVHATLEYHKFQYSVSYNEHQGKWYLNRVTRHFELLVDSKKRNWEDRLWQTDIDLVMTDLKTENVTPITTGDIGQKESAMQHLIGSDFDEAFWGNYNILKAESSDSLRKSDVVLPPQDTTALVDVFVANRANGFTRADTLRGKLTPLRTCYDVTFYHLDVAVDLEQRSIKGNNLIRFKVVAPFTRMQVDLYNNMKIERIEHNGTCLSFHREFDAVFIYFPTKQKVGDQVEIKIFYEGIPQVPDRRIPMHGGVLWEQDSLGNPWGQVVCQGSGASLWWPNKDHQSDEPDSMKIWITVPSDFTEVSNGRLTRQTPMPGDRMRYEWYVSYPINNYNATFSIGKYAHFTDQYISGDTLTIDYYVMSYNVERAKRLFNQVKPMLKTFEKYFGKYPFPRDGFAIVESLYPMEHQSGVCIGKITQQNSGDNNPLLWHEVAHEWWGNAITTKDIADMWIHEAFATYAETLIVEDWYGKEDAHQTMVEQMDAVIGEEPVTGVYDVNHIHYEIGDMYSKGSIMLHTFRNVLNNDDVWIRLLHDIQNKFRYQTLSAAELVAFINKQTGKDYKYFFDQYLHYVELPELHLQLIPQGKDLQIKYRWEANVKNFSMPVKVTTAHDKYEFIAPTSRWQTLLLRDMSQEEFDVDDENFYIAVKVE